MKIIGLTITSTVLRELPWPRTLRSLHALRNVQVNWLALPLTIKPAYKDSPGPAVGAETFLAPVCALPAPVIPRSRDSTIPARDFLRSSPPSSSCTPRTPIQPASLQTLPAGNPSTAPRNIYFVSFHSQFGKIWFLFIIHIKRPRANIPLRVRAACLDLPTGSLPRTLGITDRWTGEWLWLIKSLHALKTNDYFSGIACGDETDND